MEALFTKRAFYIRIGDNCSAKLEVKGSVPRGSVLGSLLFVLFIVDLASALKSPSFFFFGDVKVVGSTAKKTSLRYSGCPGLG